MTKEIRSCVAELRADENDGKIRGYAAVFDSLSEDLGGFREKIAKGAFSDTLNADVRALWNHDANIVLGRTTAGTLTLREDNHGLAIEIDPPNTQQANDLLISIRRGDVSQMSFGFYTKDDSWEKRDGENIRTLRKVELFDVSPVTYPAYSDTSVATRSLDGWKESQKPDYANKLREIELAERI